MPITTTYHVGGQDCSGRYLECFHLGDVVDKRGCNCPGKWHRECDRHGLCTLSDTAGTLPRCSTCPEYAATPPG